MPRRRTSDAKATEAVESLFVTAPQNQSKADKLARAGAARSPGRRRSKPKPPEGYTEAQVKDAFGQRPDAASEIDLDNLPILAAPWLKIQERVFDLPDPETEHAELEAELRLTDALTPGNLSEALNNAEDNARRAHRLYVTALAAYEAFELEMTPVVEAMRETANKDLQGEKDRKERSKAITDADIKGRASVMFPDEWARVQRRRIEAEAMMSSLKMFAELWKQRCYSLSALVNAGKRS